MDSSSVHVLWNPVMSKSINQVVLFLVWPESGLPWRALHTPEFLGLNRLPMCPLPLICDLSPRYPTWETNLSGKLRALLRVWDGTIWNLHFCRSEITQCWQFHVVHPRGFSVGATLSSLGTLGSVWTCFVLSELWGGGTGIWGVETTAAPKHSTVHRTAPLPSHPGQHKDPPGPKFQ